VRGGHLRVDGGSVPASGDQLVHAVEGLTQTLGGSVPLFGEGGDAALDVDQGAVHGGQ